MIFSNWLESKSPIQRQTSKSDIWIPKGYEIDDEFGCLSNSENLAAMNPKLSLVTGWTKIVGHKKWGAHQWCVAPNGEIVDPYFKHRFPHDWQNIEYKADDSAFG